MGFNLYALHKSIIKSPVILLGFSYVKNTIFSDRESSLWIMFILNATFFLYNGEDNRLKKFTVCELYYTDERSVVVVKRRGKNFRCSLSLTMFSLVYTRRKPHLLWLTRRLIASYQSSERIGTDRVAPRKRDAEISPLIAFAPWRVGVAAACKPPPRRVKATGVRRGAHLVTRFTRLTSR